MLKITVVAMGNKMPAWVVEATQEFAKRLQEHCQFNLIELPLKPRTASCDVSKVLEQEAQMIMAHIPNQARLMILDIEGQSFDSHQLAHRLQQLQLHSSHWCFVIGAPEGLAESVRQHAHERWSLSKLTLPHPLARVVLFEALYRGFAILKNHPYHK